METSRIHVFCLSFSIMCACQEQGRDALEQSAGAVTHDGSSPRTASALDMAAALDVPPALITGATLTGHETAAAVLPGLGVIEPTRGESFLVLSTGMVGSPPAPEPGTDLGFPGVREDAVTLRLVLDVPAGARWLTFDFQFLSAEAPEFIGSERNDVFRVRLIRASGTEVIPLASVNGSFFHAATSSRAAGTGYDIFSADPEGIDTEFTGSFPDAGITRRETARIAVEPGVPITLEFDISDAFDGLLDSAVILDDVRFTAIELLDPNPELLTAAGTVTTDIAALATGGTPIRGAVADGVTQALVRVRVPGPGMVDLTLVDGSVPADGGLSPLGATGRMSSVQVPASEVAPGIFYAFALYHSPTDFNRGADGDLAQRPVRIRAQTASGGASLATEVELEIHRPPVVLVHGLWSSPIAWWESPIARDERFTCFPADYASIYEEEAPNDSGYDLASNLPAVDEAIEEALGSTRDRDIAATQVDVVAHSIGGLLARMHIASGTYRQITNFHAGDVNRLITLNTPHLGTPMANTIVEFRQHVLTLPPNTRTSIENSLRDLEIHLFNGLIDDLAYGSGTIAALPEAQVPSHALLATGARSLSRANLLVALPAAVRPLYILIEQYHPALIGQPPLVRQRFIAGTMSRVFATEHDTFVEVASQRGGLPSSATTGFTITSTTPHQHAHFFGTMSAPYGQRLVELLNAPVGSSLFAFLPAPQNVPLP